MATNDSDDPTVQEADRRAERAKASLLSRIELLKHKLTDARDRLDVPAQIARYPLPAIGVAFALGALVGLRGTAASAASARRPVRSAATAALAAIGLRVVRNVALGQLGRIAKQWWTEQQAHSERLAPSAHGARTAGSAPPAGAMRSTERH
jgi:hypothetical protein